MRVLIAHRWYGSSVPSGEDRAVEEDIRELTDAGIEVFCSMPEGAGPSPGGLEPSSRFARYSPKAIVDGGARLLDKVRPDVVHLHNPYPEYLSLLRELRRPSRPPLVHTAHNFRHVCPAGTAFRDGRPCQDCVGERFPISAVHHRCVNGSGIKSVAMGAMVRLGEPSIAAADLRIAISRYMGDRLTLDSGPGDGPVAVLHNAVRDPRITAVRPTRAPGAPFVFFAGRLIETKGIDLLVRAVQSLPASSELHLVVAGDGPLRGLIEEAAGERGSRTHFVGQVGSAEAHGYMAAAAAVAVPSAWDEPFGLTVAESLGCGTPVLATDRGALPEIVGGCGVIVESTIAALREGLLALEEQPSDDARGRARQRWEAEFSPAQRGPALVELYRTVIDART